MIPLAAVFSLAPTAGDATDVADDLRRELDLRIESGAVEGSELSKKDRRALERALGEASDLARRVVVHRVVLHEEAVEGEPKDDSSVRVAVLALDGPLQGGKLAIAVAADGAVVQRKVWGCEEFEQDARGWTLFLEQFDRQPSLNRTLDPGQVASAKELAGRLGRLGEDESEVRALYRQRLIMRANGYRFSTKRSEMFGSGATDWLRAWQEDFSRLVEMSDDIGKLLEEGAAEQYRTAAKTGESILAAAIENMEAGNGRAAALSLKPLYSSSCQGCHEIEDHGLGEKNLYWSTMERLPELSVRDDFARVGTDVLALPGREESCQTIATGLKACLLVLGAVE